MSAQFSVDDLMSTYDERFWAQAMDYEYDILEDAQALEENADQFNYIEYETNTGIRLRVVQGGLL